MDNTYLMLLLARIKIRKTSKFKSSSLKQTAMRGTGLHIGEGFCDTCQKWYDSSLVGKTNCLVCLSRECSRHSGVIWTCELCKREDLCQSCSADYACCEWRESVGDETRVLKVQIKRLTVENKELREAVATMKSSTEIWSKMLAKPKSP